MLDRRLKKLGPSVWRYSPQAGPHGAAGVPDRIVCAGGKFFGIECKADRTKKPTRLQAKCMEKIEEAGGECFVVYDEQTINQAIERIRLWLDSGGDWVWEWLDESAD
jgi:hypothetical protein